LPILLQTIRNLYDQLFPKYDRYDYNESEQKTVQQEMANPAPKQENLHRNKRRWRHQPAVPIKCPESFRFQIEAIAEWADRQDNPVQMLQDLLAIAYQMGEAKAASQD
jgi:hypothetical protein